MDNFPPVIVYSILKEIPILQRLSILFDFEEEKRMKYLRMFYHNIIRGDIIEVFARSLPEMSFEEAITMTEDIEEDALRDLLRSYPREVTKFYHLNDNGKGFEDTLLYSLIVPMMREYKIRKIEGFSVINSIYHPREVYDLIISSSSLDYKEIYLQQYQKKGFFIVLLLSSQREIIGYVHGYIDRVRKNASIYSTEINKEYRGKGLCVLLWEEMFLCLREEEITEIEVVNTGGEKAYWCYKKAAESLGYLFRCKDVRKEEVCHLMKFVLNPE